MSKENVMRFFENTKTDQDLKSQYQEIMRRFTQEDISEELINTVEQDLISLAKSAGYDFSLKELNDFKKTESKQLSEEELDKIVGGSGSFDESYDFNGRTIRITYICNGAPDSDTFRNIYIGNRDSMALRTEIMCPHFSNSLWPHGHGCCPYCDNLHSDVDF